MAGVGRRCRVDVDGVGVTLRCHGLEADCVGAKLQRHGLDADGIGQCSGGAASGRTTSGGAQVAGVPVAVVRLRGKAPVALAGRDRAELAASIAAKERLYGRRHHVREAKGKNLERTGALCNQWHGG